MTESRHALPKVIMDPAHLDSQQSELCPLVKQLTSCTSLEEMRQEANQTGESTVQYSCPLLPSTHLHAKYECISKLNRNLTPCE